MKIVVFGVGEFYRKRKERLLSYSNIEQVAFIDNNKSIHPGLRWLPLRSGHQY